MSYASGGSSANFKIFFTTFSNWIDNISINSIVMLILMVFMIFGAVDRIRGNKLGYGEEFENGIKTMGPLVLAVAAIIAVAPMLAHVLAPFLDPIAAAIGADTSVFPGILLGSDMGGYSLAAELAHSKPLGDFNGLVVASIMGPVLTFTIPVALSIINKKDRPFLAEGILAGLVTVPLGCIAGGAAMILIGYDISFVDIILNTVPVIIIAALVMIGLWRFPSQTIRGFSRFGNAVTAVVTVLTAIAIFQQVTGIMLPVFYVMSVPDQATGMTGLDSGIAVCGKIGIVLAGAFPMMKWITDTFGSKLKAFGSRLSIDELSSAGFIASMANVIPMLNTFGKMGTKGKILNVAFAVSGMCVLGDFLGFTAGVNQQMVIPVIVGKITAGITAVLAANILASKLLDIVRR